jgi:Flp pilus assembly pilin Flp
MDVRIAVIMQALQARFRSDDGANLVEYGLLVGLIAILALVAVQLFGQGVSSHFSMVTSQVNS